MFAAIHNFKSRKALVAAVTDQMFFAGNPFTLAAQQTGLNALEKLRFVLKYNLSWNSDNPGMAGEVKKIEILFLQSKTLYSQLSADLLPLT